MREVTDENPSRGTQRKRTIFSLERIADVVSARKAAKRGAISGLIFAGMYLLGGVFVYFGTSPTDGAEMQDSWEFDVTPVFDALLTILILFLAWRVKTGRGWISSILLLIWFIGEATMKFLDGSTHAAWILFYLAVAVGLIDGVRGTWAYRKYTSQVSPPSATPAAS